MALRFSCPKCGHALSAPEGCAGRSSKCQACGQAVTVPVPVTQPVSPVSIRFACPVCKSIISAPAQRAGDKVACPKCQQRLQIPAPVAKPAHNKTVLGSLLSFSQTTAAPSLPTMVPPQPGPPSPQLTPPVPPTRSTKPPSLTFWLIVSAGVMLPLICVCTGIGVWISGVGGRSGNSTVWEREDYHPLRQGARWEYDAEWQRGNGPIEKGSVVERIDGEERINGKTYVKRVVTATAGMPGRNSGTSYLRTDGTGTYMISKENLDVGEIMTLPNPAKVGKEWKVDNSEVRFRVESEEDVDVPDKTYKRCIKVRMTATEDGLDVTIDTFYAPGVGMVQTAGTLKDGRSLPLKFTTRLKKYAP